MRQEWREYWYHCRVKTVHILWAVPVSLLFFIGYLPVTPSEEWLSSLKICLGFGFIISTTHYLLMSLSWGIVTSVYVRTGRFYELGVKSNLLLGFCSTTIGVYLATRWKAWVLGAPFAHSGLWTALLFGVAINLGFVFYFAYKGAKQENLELKAASAEANYRTLKNQMQPHFLFNSLNSLSELIESDKDKAAEMTQNLADLYREILENSKQKTSSLASEVSIVRKYLELERLRFGERLDFSIEVPPHSDTIFLPSLVLQTLVENALKHGLAKSTEGGSVAVHAIPSDKGFRIAVQNTGAWDGSTGEGNGLANTRSRLSLLYGESYGLDLFCNDGQTTARFEVTGEQLV